MATSGLRVGSLLSAEQLCEIVGLAKGSLGPMAWLVIQELAAGASLKGIGESLGCTLEELIQLRDDVTGKTEKESEELWGQCVLTLKMASRLNQQSVAGGWEAVEAIALQKVHATLMETKSNGDLTQMMGIATQANKAIRRQAGEGQPGGRSGSGMSLRVNPNTGDMEAELNSGDLGFIRLRIHPTVAQQMSAPERVIDGTVRKPSMLQNMEMIGFDDTRAAGDEMQKNDVDNKAEMNDSLRKMFE